MIGFVIAGLVLVGALCLLLVFGLCLVSKESDERTLLARRDGYIRALQESYRAQLGDRE